MINYDSILSAFDGKPTLLQWLKMVKKALDESVLKNVDITQNGQKVVFTFNFEDGTSISTPEVTLPKGDKGSDGVGIVRIETSNSQVVGGFTESTISVELSDSTVKNFKTYAKNGSDGINGNDGVSITGINTVRNEVVGDETLTTLRANYSNDTSDEFVVTAKNGKDATSGEGSIYTHFVKFNSSFSSAYMSIILYSKKETLTLEDALSQIPTGGLGVPVYFIGQPYEGVMSAYREGNVLHLKGVVYNSSESAAVSYSTNMTPGSINDKLLGVNL